MSEDGAPYNIIGKGYLDLRPGDRVAFECGGEIYTDTVQSITISSAELAIHRKLTAWQRITRRLTPPRFRKPVKPVRPAKPATVTISTGPGHDESVDDFGDAAR